MVLSDRTIREELAKGRIVIDPLAERAIQPASVDLRLGRKFRVFRQHKIGYVDVKDDPSALADLVDIDELNPFYLHPGEFALGVTLERIELPADIVGRLDGKSSLGRLGLVVHSTAGWVDPGWKGHLTLELSNLLQLPITLYAGMLVSQISFLRLSSPAEHPYGSTVLRSKYQGQDEPAASKYYLNFHRRTRRKG